MRYIEVYKKPSDVTESQISKLIKNLDIPELEGLRVEFYWSKTKKDLWLEIKKNQNKPWDPNRMGWTRQLKSIFGSGYTNGWTECYSADRVNGGSKEMTGDKFGEEPWRKYIKGDVTKEEKEKLDKYEKYWNDFSSFYDPQDYLDGLRNKAPKAEKQIKISGDSAKILKAFVDKNLGEIDSNHKITTFFIDTDAEYKKYNVSIPAICLVCMDKRATKATMKKEPIVQKFDKSKTLKRYSDWKKGTVANVEGECWYTIYVSAKDARNNGIKALKEEVQNMKLVGYLNEEGSLVRTPVDGDVVIVEGEPYIVESVDGQMVNLLNEDSSFEVNEGELDEEIVEITANSNSGKVIDGMVCLGETELGEAYVNDSDEVFIREAFTDKLEGEMVYRDRKTNKPVVTGELDPKKDTIMYWNTEGDHYTIKKSEFTKKFKAGKAEDFELFEGK